MFSLTKLPIDAVPDITNNQVQINTVGAVATRPVDIEKQVTYPVETALAGIKGLEYTRSHYRETASPKSRRSSVRSSTSTSPASRSAERLAQAKAGPCRPGAEPSMGPISTGLGEIYMWSIHYAKPKDRKVAP